MKCTLTTVAVALLFMFNSCSDSSTGPFFANNSRMTFTISKNDAPLQYYEMNAITSCAIYDTTIKHTSCVFIGSSESIPAEVNIKYYGTSPGIYHWLGTATVSITISPQTFLGQKEIWSSTNSGETRIYNYAKQNDPLTGDFSGYFVCNLPSKRDTILIDGVFETTTLQ